MDRETFEDNFRQFTPEFIKRGVSESMIHDVLSRIILVREIRYERVHYTQKISELPHGSLLNRVGGGEKPIINVKPFSDRIVLFPEEVQLLVNRDFKEIQILTTHHGVTLKDIVTSMTEIFHLVFVSSPTIYDDLIKKLSRETGNSKYATYNQLEDILISHRKFEEYKYLLSLLTKRYISKDDRRKLGDFDRVVRHFFGYDFFNKRSFKFLSLIPFNSEKIDINLARRLMDMLGWYLRFDRIEEYFKTKNIYKSHNKVFLRRERRYSDLCPIIGCNMELSGGDIEIDFFPIEEGKSEKHLRMNCVSVHLVAYHCLFEKGPGSTEDQYYPTSPTEYFNDFMKQNK